MKKVETNYESRMEWVPVSDAEIEPKAQRHFDEKRAWKIADDLDPDLIGIPLIWAEKRAENWRFVVIDGQHRFAAVRRALGDDQRLLCEVIRGIDLKRAAQLFRGRNTAVKPKAIDSFLTGITGKDIECLAIDKIVQAAGYAIADTTGDGYVRCVKVLQRIYRFETAGDKGGILGDALAITTAAYGRTTAAVAGDLLLGLGFFLWRYRGEIDRAVFTKKLAGCKGGALGLIGRARAAKDVLRGELPQCMARLLVDLYNTGRSTGRLGDWDIRREKNPSKENIERKRQAA